MFSVNEYFSGQVKSIAFQTATLPATIGVMAPGAYTFSTDRLETMTVISGLLTVQLPGSPVWQDFAVGQSFVVAAQQSFHLRVAENTAYLCTYA
ncbi:MAG: pyrimidine/purine nucleoside phosphorylase [Magnetococcales bacterium]|nr:pyrimidine/purine nucleoside phosphorylase [Magnetococcales bacterium]